MNHLACLVLSLVYLRILWCVRAHVLAKPMGRLTSLTMRWHPFPFWPPRNLSAHMYVGKLSLTSRMRNMWSFISYLCKAQPPPSCCFYGVSAIMQFLYTREKLPSLGPIDLLPHSHLLLISTAPWQSWLDHIGRRKLPHQAWRRNCWCLLRKKVVFSSSLLSLWL